MSPPVSAMSVPQKSIANPSTKAGPTVGGSSGLFGDESDEDLFAIDSKKTSVATKIAGETKESAAVSPCFFGN